MHHARTTYEGAAPAPSAVQVSVNDFIVRAVALALVDVPGANAQWDAKTGEVVPCPGVDIAIAVATDKGLITPIVRGAAAKSLTQISAEARRPTPPCSQSLCVAGISLRFSRSIPRCLARHKAGTAP